LFNYERKKKNKVNPWLRIKRGQCGKKKAATNPSPSLSTHKPGKFINNRFVQGIEG
jgi:hypothetical protein